MIRIFENDTIEEIVDIIEDAWDDAIRLIKEEDHASACGALRLYFDGIEEIHLRGYFCYIDQGKTKVMKYEQMF